MADYFLVEQAKGPACDSRGRREQEIVSVRPWQTWLRPDD